MFKKLSWIFTLLAYEVLMVYLIYSNRISVFLNPKMNKYIYFSIAVIFILLIVEFYDLFKKKYYSRVSVSIIMFLIPLVLIIYQSAPEKRSNTQTQSAASVGNLFRKLDTLEKEETASLENMSDEEEAKYFMDSLNDSYNDLYDNGFKKYNGKEFEISGMVFFDEKLKGNEFAVTRLLMTCCAADAANVGFLVEYNGDEIFEEGEWVRVKGTMGKGKQFNKVLDKEEEVPKIIIKSIKKITPPSSPYVYP